MGIVQNKPKVNIISNLQLSIVLQKKIIELFQVIDRDNSLTLDKDETLSFWCRNFPKLNTYDLFQQVDKNGDGLIQIEEWMEFWEYVFENGYTEVEIEKQIDNMMDGGSWEKFKKKRKIKQ